jgi:hypothetical protein
MDIILTDNSHPLHSHRLAWRQAAHRLPLFHLTISWGPREVVQYIGYNIRLLLTIFTEGAGTFLSFVSQASIPPNVHVVNCTSKCKLSGPTRSDERQLLDTIISLQLHIKPVLCVFTWCARARADTHTHTHTRARAHTHTHTHTPHFINNKIKTVLLICFFYIRYLLSLFHIKIKEAQSSEDPCILRYEALSWASHSRRFQR